METELLENEEVIEEEPVYDDVVEEEIVEEEEPVVSLSVESSYDLQILQELQKSNSNWDLFLDSFDVPYIRTETLSNNISNSYYSSAQNIVYVQHGVGNNNCFYFPVVANNTYTFNYTYSKWQFYCVFTQSDPLTINSSGSPFFSVPTFTSTPISGTFEYTPTVNGYVCIVSYSDGSTNNSFNVSFNDFYRESYTLSEIGNSITSVDTKIDSLGTIVEIETGLLIISLFTLVVSACRKLGKKFVRKGD